MENKFIILIQYGISIEPAYWNEHDRPILFDTEAEATQKMNEDFEYMVSIQKNEVEAGAREPEDVDEECEEWVEKCTVDDNGCIFLENDGEIYNPKTYKR